MRRLINKTKEEVWETHLCDIVIEEGNLFYYTNEEWEKRRKKILNTLLL